MSVGSPELCFPHEAADRMMAVSGLYGENVAESLVVFGALGVVSKAGELRSVHSSRPFQWSTRRQFELFTGTTAGAELMDKEQFGEIIQQLGYIAPRSVVIIPNGDRLGTADRVAALDTLHAERFLKPVCGSRAKGTMQAGDAEQAVAFAYAERRPYLAQTLHNTDHEWRYVMHRDAAAVYDNMPHNWRIMFRKIRPSLVGDGICSLDELVAANQRMPWYSRLKYRVHQGRDGERVPAQGEHVELAVGGNVGAQLPESDELRNLDTFMQDMAMRLENKLGTMLATICFDVGVKTLTHFVVNTIRHDCLVS